MAGVAERTVAYLHELRGKAHERYTALSYGGKVALWFWVGLHVLGMFTMWYIGPVAFMEAMAKWATSLRDSRFGWALLVGLIILTSIPPIMGYGTTITLAGFAFGVGRGWLIGSAGCILGALVSFTISRRLISRFAPLLAQDKTFKALAHAIRAKGLGLVVLVRLCPFPFPYSNAFFASIESVSLWQFFIATLAITPKLLLHVWVGSRMYLFADGDERGKMDFNTKVINGLYVALGSLLGMGTSYYVYKLTMHYVNEVGSGDDGLDLEDGVIHDVDAMLDEEEYEDDVTPHAEAASPLLLRKAASPVPPVTRTTPIPATSRQSEDRWDSNFSDFDETESRPESEIGDDDLLGLNEPRPSAITMDSSATIRAVDKRAD